MGDEVCTCDEVYECVMHCKNTMHTFTNFMYTLDDAIWRHFCLWILAPGIEPGVPDPALIYQPVG